MSQVIGGLGSATQASSAFSRHAICTREHSRRRPSDCQPWPSTGGNQLCPRKYPVGIHVVKSALTQEFGGANAGVLCTIISGYPSLVLASLVDPDDLPPKSQTGFQSRVTTSCLPTSSSLCPILKNFFNRLKMVSSTNVCPQGEPCSTTRRTVCNIRAAICGNNVESLTPSHVD